MMIFTHRSVKIHMLGNKVKNCQPRKENPVELVEEPEVVAAVDDKATFSVEDHRGSEETIFNHIVRHHCCKCT